MDDLIYRETARRAYEKSLENDKHKIEGASAIHMQEHRHMLHVLDKIPAVDAVQVVRCKDYKYWAHGDCYRIELSRPNDFCSYGERREDDG